MRKAIVVLCFIFTFCLFGLTLLGFNSSRANAHTPCIRCRQENCICFVDFPDIVDLNSQIISQIKQDYKDYLSHSKNITLNEEDISIIGYYGTYSGHYDVTSIAIKFQILNMEYLQVKHEFLIGNINDKTRFVYPDSNAIMIWCRPHIPSLTEWNIHTIQRAHGYGYLTSSEVRTIGALHEYELFDYFKNNRFDTDLEKQIKQDYYYNYGMDKTWTHNGVEYNYTYDDVYILGYYGEYSSGAVSLMISAAGFGHFCVETSETVDGITFYYSSSNQIQVWHDGNFYKLSDTKKHDYQIIDGQSVYAGWQTVQGAYTLGLITYEELLITHKLFNA